MELDCFLKVNDAHLLLIISVYNMPIMNIRVRTLIFFALRGAENLDPENASL